VLCAKLIGAMHEGSLDIVVRVCMSTIDFSLNQNYVCETLFLKPSNESLRLFQGFHFQCMWLYSFVNDIWACVILHCYKHVMCFGFLQLATPSSLVFQIRT
jgi:hypothetical protein